MSKKICAFDNNFLARVFRPDLAPPFAPSSQKPVLYMRERISTLLDHLKSENALVILPSPCVAEMLSAYTNTSQVMNEINRMSYLKCADLGVRGAIQLGKINNAAIQNGDKRNGSLDPWQKVKIDRQIAVIAQVHGAQDLYTDDKTLSSFAEKECSMNVIHSWDLEIDDKYKQISMRLTKNDSKIIPFRSK